MACWLRQSTAVDIALGPFVDSVTGVDPETALSLTSAETRLKKNNGAWAARTDVTTGTHEEEGWYEIELDATDTNTLGVLVIAVYIAGALPVWREFMVLPAVVYDSLVLGTDLLDVSLVQVAGVAVSTTTAQLGVNTVSMSAGAVTAAAIATDAIDDDAIATGAIASSAFAAGAITAAAIAADAIGASELAADAVTEIQAGLATAAALATVQADTDDIQTRLPAALVSGRIDASVGAMAAGTVTAAAIATGAIDADALAADAVDEIWAKAMTELTVVPGVTGTVLQALQHCFMRLSQRRTETAAVETIYQADAVTVYATSSKSDNGTTFDSGKDTTA